jgi:hypothetical protein
LLISQPLVDFDAKYRFRNVMSCTLHQKFGFEIGKILWQSLALKSKFVEKRDL